jgi:hypothetical protein
MTTAELAHRQPTMLAMVTALSVAILGKLLLT